LVLSLKGAPKPQQEQFRFFLELRQKARFLARAFSKKSCLVALAQGVLRDYLFIYYLRARKYLPIFIILDIICTRPSPNMFDAAAK
jgi:hypothetical protein